MKTRVVRIEQKEFDQEEVDKKINAAITELESGGHQVRDVRIAVGRDAWEGSGVEVRYSVTALILYEENDE